MEMQWFLIFYILLQNYFSFGDFQFESKECVFPDRWTGFWFQSGVQNNIIIKNQIFSTKGRCVASDGDKFLIVDEKQTCYRCVVIHEKHINVLQYKETYCFNKQYPLSKICTSISGDASLYSMFREDAKPMNCPFFGSYTFSYNKGHGECKNPISTIQTCSSRDRLLFNYQSCYDIMGTEATVEELECLATWKEGSLRFLIGKMYHTHALTNEDRFRCFVYENRNLKSQLQSFNRKDAFKIAQSGDATCNGLFSVSEGSKTLKLYQNLDNNRKCDFPLWLNVLSDWSSLDSVWKYSFYAENSSIIITNSTGMQINLYCHEIIEQSHDKNYSMVLAKYKMGCQNGFVCINFNRKAENIAKSQIGNYVKIAEDACSLESFDRYTLPHITLVSSKLKKRKCSLSGKFSLNSLSNFQQKSSLLSSPARNERKDVFLENHQTLSSNFAIATASAAAAAASVQNIKSLNRKMANHISMNDCQSNGVANLLIGCNQKNLIEFYSTCSINNLITSYHCYDQWNENGTYYIITTPQNRPSLGAQRFCFMYQRIEETVFLFSSSSLTCWQNFKAKDSLIFNATKINNCNVLNRASSSQPKPKILQVSLFAILLIILLNCNNR